MIVECIKEGFRLTHRNWQLILIHVIVALINVVSLFFFIGLPVFIAITYLGFDVVHIKDILPSLLSDPRGFVARYLGLLFFIISAIFFYLVFVTILYLYIIGGTIGVLRNSVMDNAYRFSLSFFFREAGRHLTRLFWLLALLMLAITGFFVVFVTSGGIAMAVLEGIDIRHPSIQMFFSSFISLFIMVFGLIILYFAIVFAAYSFIVLVIEGEGVMESIRGTFNFLKDNTMAFLYYFLLLIGIGIANLVVVSLSVIPVIAPLINLFLQNYLSVVLWSCLVAFYVKRRGYPIRPIISESTAGSSSSQVPFIS